MLILTDTLIKMNHLDLFSGVGGFSLGLKRAGIEVGWHGFSDIDKHANKVFKRRFPNAEELGSITDINPRKLPRIDLITFGFPCQDLSLANRKRGGLQANRSGLFFEAMRIIRVKKPKYFIFENVKGLFSSNEGQDFDIILREIADIGYDGQWELCNTRLVGHPKPLPQNRERIYFVGHIRGECFPKVFPLSDSNQKNRKAQGFNNDSHCIRTITTAHAHGTSTNMSYIIQGNSKIRRLTPSECEALQGFEIGWTDCCSDTQRYKQMGNAVTVNVVEAIFKKLYKEIA